MNDRTTDHDDKTEELRKDAQATKDELLKNYWNDPDLHMTRDFSGFCDVARKELVRALGAQIVTKPE